MENFEIYEKTTLANLLEAMINNGKRTFGTSATLNEDVSFDFEIKIKKLKVNGKKI